MSPHLGLGLIGISRPLWFLFSAPSETRITKISNGGSQSATHPAD